MDADGIPLYTKTHWQNASFLGQVCGMSPRITFHPMCNYLFRDYQVDDGTRGAGPENAAFCW